MKTILLIRHAKSSRDFNVDDFDRALNHRGKADAPAMAERLRQKRIEIDVFISSTANRAFSTAVAFAGAYDRSSKDILAIGSLYEAPPAAFTKVIETIYDQFSAAALFAHNPGITAFANQLTSTAIDDMPTCAVFAVRANVEKWKDFEAAAKEFWFFDYPKAV